jgi:hypothetical protein
MRRKRNPRRKKLPPLPTIDLDNWLSKHPGYLFSCPNQPGNLKLSESACVKRYLTANEPRWANIGAEPYPIFVIKMNLIPCRECEVGAKLAKRRQGKAA